MSLAGLIENFITVITQHYVDFNGRARRREFWHFFLVNLVIVSIFGILSQLLGFFNVVSSLYGLAVFLPGLGLSVRRLHDTDKSGALFWLALIPLIGAIILIVFCCVEGTRGPNRFGPDPKDPYGQNTGQYVYQGQVQEGQYGQAQGYQTQGYQAPPPPPPYQPPAAASCPHCGAAMPAGKRFCPNCGAQLS